VASHLTDKVCIGDRCRGPMSRYRLLRGASVVGLLNWCGIGTSIAGVDLSRLPYRKDSWLLSIVPTGPRTAIASNPPIAHPGPLAPPFARIERWAHRQRSVPDTTCRARWLGTITNDASVRACGHKEPFVGNNHT